MLNGPLHGKRIIVVEDEYFAAIEVSNAIKTAGGECIGPYSSISDSLIEGINHHIDAAVLDVNIRDDLIYPVADLILQKGIRLIFVTGIDLQNIPAGYRSNTVLLKPVNINYLIALLADRER